MKTVKRVLAIAVAVLMLAMMIPAASAAAANTINWTCAKPGYTYTVYKVADYNETTGAFTATVASLQSKVDTSVTEAQMRSLADACKTAALPSAGITFKTDAKSGSFTVDNGIYYIKMTEKSPNFKAITQESIVVFPNKDGATSRDIDFGAKINEGEPTADKSFLVNGTETKEEQTFGTTPDTKTITYVLTADIAGSKDSKLTSYVITDKMGAGLNTAKHDVKSVVLKNGSTETELTYTVSTDAAVINRAKADTLDKKNETTGNTFGVVIDAAELSKDAFYTEGNKVVVTYTTELLASAAVAASIPNSDDMIYGNTSGYNVVPGNTVTLKTYTVKAYKEDATTGAKLAGATFALYDADKKQIATATSVATTGEADFEVLLPAGTYYVKETAAPEGYNLNSTEETITLGDATPNGIATVTIKDTKAKLPATGGTGTMVFTIVGGSLVLLAAALFVIVMKKRSAAK